MACFRSAVVGGLAARAITRLGKDILLLLNGYGRCGGIWPSHETIAARVNCEARSVRRTLAELRQAGWVKWERRYRRVGAYLRQASNLYTLAIPAELRRRPRRADGLLVRQMETKKEIGFGSVAQQLAALGVSPMTAAERMAFRAENERRAQEQDRRWLEERRAKCPWLYMAAAL